MYMISSGKQVINVSGVKKPSTGFNHIVRASGFLFLASQLSANLKTGKVITGSVKDQTRQALDNIRYLLANCGSSMDDIVKVTIYFRNSNDRKEINEIYKNYFIAGKEPVKTSVQAASPIEGIDVEIDVIAVAR